MRWTRRNRLWRIICRKRSGASVRECSTPSLPPSREAARHWRILRIRRYPCLRISVSRSHTPCFSLINSMTCRSGSKRFTAVVKARRRLLMMPCGSWMTFTIISAVTWMPHSHGWNRGKIKRRLWGSTSGKRIPRLRAVRPGRFNPFLRIRVQSWRG